MNNKKSHSFYVVIAIIFSLLYIFIAVKPLGTEYQFVPEWKIDVTNPSVTSDISMNDKTFLSFKLGQKMGYFTPEGKVINFVTFPQKASISDTYYTYYNINNSKTKFFKPDGTECGVLDFSGFPMIDEERVFIFLPGGSSFNMCNTDGSLKWEFSGTSPITAFDSSDNGITCGFADGYICLFDNDGNLIHRFAPGGSSLPVVSGIAVSDSGNYVAAICGQEKQRFVLAKTNETQPKIIFHEFLSSSKTRQNLVKFSSDDSVVFYNCDEYLGIVDVKTSRKAHLKIDGQAIAIKPAGNCAYVLTKQNRKYTVYCIEKFATLIGSFSFEADTSFIQTKENKLYIGRDSAISCIKLEKK